MGNSTSSSSVHFRCSYYWRASGQNCENIWELSRNRKMYPLYFEQVVKVLLRSLKTGWKTETALCRWHLSFHPKKTRFVGRRLCWTTRILRANLNDSVWGTCPSYLLHFGTKLCNLPQFGAKISHDGFSSSFPRFVYLLIVFDFPSHSLIFVLYDWFLPGYHWLLHGFPGVFHGFHWCLHGFPWVFHGIDACIE